MHRLIDELSHQYREKTGKSYGKFTEDRVHYPMVQFMTDYYLKKKHDFYTLSCQMMTHLQARANDVRLSTGGYILTAHIESQNQAFMLVAVIHQIIGDAITQNLDIIDSTHLDLEHFKVAGRIHLTQWKNQVKENYLSFLKGTSEVAIYFQKFLGCNDTKTIPDETRFLINALQDFSQHMPQQSQWIENFKQYALCLIEKQTPLTFTALAEHMWSQAPHQLIQFLNDEARPLSDHFISDKRTIQKMGLFTFKMTTDILIQFTAQSIQNEWISYDAKANQLIIKKIPEKIKKVLLQAGYFTNKKPKKL